jgi:hypothetical protein
LRQAEGAAAETATGFKKKEVSLADLIHSRARAAAENQLATKRILNIRGAKLLNKQPCPRHHASAFLLRAFASGVRRVSVSG